MELKAVPAKLDVAEQLVKYKQALEGAGQKNVIMWLVAPLIPKHVSDFLDRFGVEHTEIHEAEFRQIAARHNYVFASETTTPKAHVVTVERTTKEVSPNREVAFQEAMLEIYEKAKKECRYNASRFFQMITEQGGLQTARYLLHAPGLSDGFTALWKCKRLDLTVEAYVLKPEWRDLFTEEERKVAAKRLSDLGYSPEWPAVEERQSNLGQHYDLVLPVDHRRLRDLIQRFRSVVRREIDTSLAVNLTHDLLEREAPHIEHETLLQLARWCNTTNPLYADGMEVAREISTLLFGVIVDRERLAT
jgi:hypothetical protein